MSNKLGTEGELKIRLLLCHQRSRKNINKSWVWKMFLPWIVPLVQVKALKTYGPSAPAHSSSPCNRHSVLSDLSPNSSHRVLAKTQAIPRIPTWFSGLQFLSELKFIFYLALSVSTYTKWNSTHIASLLEDFNINLPPFK